MQEFKDSPDFSTADRVRHLLSAFNHDDPVFENVNIRQAFLIGFDREPLTDKILNDGSEPAYGLVPPAIAGPREPDLQGG